MINMNRLSQPSRTGFRIWALEVAMTDKYTSGRMRILSSPCELSLVAIFLTSQPWLYPLFQIRK